jgi:hypothetical protein
MPQLFTNNAVSLLAAPISATATSLQVLPGHGALYPQPGSGDFFLITLENQNATLREIIKVTGRSGDTFTFSLADRGQEGTTAQAWTAHPGADTLVDHRITAETIRQAFLQPALSPGTAWINGETTGPILIEPAWTIPISSVVYSQHNRGFKFLVTMVAPANGLSQTFEMLANVSGNIMANTETVTFTRYSRSGYNFNGVLNVSLTTLSNTLTVTWQNNESINVEVMVTRIQHA